MRIKVRRSERAFSHRDSPLEFPHVVTNPPPRELRPHDEGEAFGQDQLRQVSSCGSNFGGR